MIVQECKVWKTFVVIIDWTLLTSRVDVLQLLFYFTALRVLFTFDIEIVFQIRSRYRRAVDSERRHLWAFSVSRWWLFDNPFDHKQLANVGSVLSHWDESWVNQQNHHRHFSSLKLFVWWRSKIMKATGVRHQELTSERRNCFTSDERKQNKKKVWRGSVAVRWPDTDHTIDWLRTLHASILE